MMIEPFDLARNFIERHPADAARVLESLSAARTGEFLAELDGKSLARVVNRLPPDYTAACVPQLPFEKKLEIFRQMDTQVALDVFRYLDAKEKYHLLPKLPLGKRLALQTINKYAQNSVGSWMSTEFFSVREDKTVEEVIELIQGTASSEAAHDDVFVVDARRKFIAIVKTSQLLKTSLSAQIGTVNNAAAFSLPARVSIQDVAEYDAWAHFKILPVVEHDNRLVGALAYKDLARALEKAHSEFSTHATGIGDDAFTLFWILFNNLIELFSDLYAIAMRKPGKTAPKEP